MMFSLIAALVLGFQHAFELDHVAALTSFSSADFSAGARNVAKWVFGHFAIIFAAALLLYMSGVTFIATEKLDIIVGIVLIALAVNKLRHLNAAANPAHAAKLGILHGLSGTGAFVALAFATAASVFDLVVFSALFGVGLALGAVVAVFLLFVPFSTLLRSRGRELNVGYAVFTALIGAAMLVR